jgi:hypothetical protein
MVQNLTPDGFDGEGFAEFLIAVILIALLFYGSKDIKGLSGQPTQD